MTVQQIELEAPDAVRPPGRRRVSPHQRRQVALIASIAIGGACGALLRDLAFSLFPTPAGTFPWVTFVVNVSGSAVLGFLLVLLAAQFPRSRLARAVIGTGVIGAYTTFSTFVVEADLLLRSGRITLAITYILGSVTAGVAAALLGSALARIAIRAETYLREME